MMGPRCDGGSQQLMPGGVAVLFAWGHPSTNILKKGPSVIRGCYAQLCWTLSLSFVEKCLHHQRRSTRLRRDSVRYNKFIFLKSSWKEVSMHSGRFLNTAFRLVERFTFYAACFLCWEFVLLPWLRFTCKSRCLCPAFYRRGGASGPQCVSPSNPLAVFTSPVDTALVYFSFYIDVEGCVWCVCTG